MTSPTRLLIYESYVAKGKVSGELRTVLYLLRFFDRSVIQPMVVLPFAIEGLRSEEERGTPVVVIEPPPALRAYGGALTRRGLIGKLSTAWALLTHARHLAAFLRRERIDVVYCCSIRAVLLVGLAARVTRTPLLFYVNSALNNPVLDTIAFVLATRVVFQCGANRDDRYPLLRRWLNRRLGVIESGLDLAVIDRVTASAPSPQALGVDPGPLNLVVLGLLNREKGVHVLLDALSRLGNRAQVRLWVVGDQVTADFSNYREQLEAQIVALGLQGCVHMAGWRSDALEFLTAMDVLIHPSFTEGMPRAVLEAMALGKTVIATQVGCCREVLQHDRNGLLVPPDDVASLTEAMDRVVGDAALRQRLGAAARAAIRDSYDIRDKVRSVQQMLLGMSKGH